MSYKKGFTKRLAQTIPEIKRIQEQNPDIGIYAGERELKASYVDFNLKAIFVSFAKIKKTAAVSIILHELGHFRIGYRSRNIIQNEINAWIYAKQYATKFKLPFSCKVAEDAIMSYMETYEQSKVVYDAIRPSKRQIKECTYQKFFETIFLKEYCYH